MANLLALNNARTTFQRVTDAKFLSGWVKQIGPDSIVAYTCTDSRVECGDEFSFQVYGNGQDAFFRGTVVFVQGVDPGPLFSKKRHSGYSLEVECKIIGPMTFQDSREQPRFYVNGFNVQFVNEGVLSERFTILDIGPLGFSVITDNAYRKSDRLSVVVQTKGQAVHCTVEVRNCIAYPLHKEYHRVGLQLIAMSRIDARKWKEIYGGVLEAGRVPGVGPQVDSQPNRRKKRAA